MRLIDADKTLEWVDCMKPIHGIGLEPVVAVETVRDLIKGSPTIDAIPVEWLRSVHENWLLTPDEMEFRDWLIERWQKEQEVQDG